VQVIGKDFSPDSTVYFGGFQVRDLSFVNSSTLQVVTPYLRPGTYKVQVKSQHETIQSEFTFTVLAASVDSDIDRADALAAKKKTPEAIAILSHISKSQPDYQVRAYVYFRLAQIYLAQGEYWRAAGAAAAIWDPKAGVSIQTAWSYRVLDEETSYPLSISEDRESDLRNANWAVEKDVTGNPEPLFFRALLNARFGNLVNARADQDAILKSAPGNPSYRALAEYISALAGDKSHVQPFSAEPINDARALGLFGQAAYLSGDRESARSWWAMEARIDTTLARLAYWSGKKHLQFGQERVAAALLAECSSVSPGTEEGKQAKDLLAGLPVQKQ
jgi:tetratricopeptide (TPR) repeat protein